MHEALARSNFESDVAALVPATVSALRYVVHEKAFPVLDVTIQHSKSLRLRFRAENWDEVPPSITLLKPDGSPWTEPLPGDQFNSGPHSATGLPFICMRGAYEYHTHSSHTNDLWENYRGQDGNELVGLLMQLSTAWRGKVK